LCQLRVRRLHRAIYALGKHTQTVCEAQFEALEAGRDAHADPKLDAALDAGVAGFVAYVVDLARALADMGIAPYLVFDGDSLPAKKVTEGKRLRCVGASFEHAIACHGF